MQVPPVHRKNGGLGEKPPAKTGGFGVYDIRDVKELNEFLARFKITGGKHEGYHRTFNNCAWDKGGRLYSDGEGNYQLMPEHKRLEMMINGEPVAEIDIKASHLTIYHAMVGEPLEGREDPYARAEIDRDVAKLWCTASFGNSAPKRKWSAEMVKEYQKKTGQDLRKVAKASELAKAMLSAFPALQKLKQHPHIWADLQFKEAEAVIRTMLILKRRHGVETLRDGGHAPYAVYYKDQLSKARALAARLRGQ
jgi:hypothetical protein